MSRRRSRIERLAWTLAVAASFVLKAAVPMLAATAAAAQGLPVADVCPVYGVRLAAVEPDPHAHHHHHAQGADAADTAASAGDEHRQHEARAHGEHCALGGLSLAAPATPASAAVLAPPPAVGAEARRDGAAAPRDAAARWVALRKHGPPRAA